jgi:hypothetical protein
MVFGTDLTTMSGEQPVIGGKFSYSGATSLIKTRGGFLDGAIPTSHPIWMLDLALSFIPIHCWRCLFGTEAMGCIGKSILLSHFGFPPPFLPHFFGSLGEKLGLP